MVVGMATKMEAVVSSIVGGGIGRREYRWRPLFAVFLASLQAMSAGAIIGWDPVDCVDNHCPWPDEPWLPSAAALGAVVGAAPAGYLADILGRRTLILASAAPGVAGWSLIVAAYRHAEATMLLYAGRFISGLSVGAASVAVSMYSSEVAPCRNRGALGSLQFLMYAAGIAWARALAVFAPPLWLSSAAGVSQAVFALVLVCAPESPTFLVRRGRIKNAEMSLSRLGAADPGRDLRELENLARDKPTAARVLRVGVIVVGLMVFRQLVGARAVAALSRMVFPPYWSAACPPALALAMAGMLGTLLPAIFGDAVGRKVLLTSSGAAMVVCHLALSVFLFVRGSHPGQDLTAIAWLPVASALVHAAAFGVGFGALPWVLVSEVAPPAIKGPVVSLAVCSNWVLALVLSRAFYGSPESVQHPVLSLVFCCSCWVGILFVVLFVPETKRRSLKEVQSLLK